MIDQTSLMLDVKQSTISSIGLAGSESLLTYRLLGNTLSLENDQIKLTMAPDTSAPRTNPTVNQTPTAPQGNGSGNSGTEDHQNDSQQSAANSEPLVGHWSCSDKSGNLWQLNYRTDNILYIEVFDTTHGRGSIWLQGQANITRSTTNTSSPDATLTVTSSDVSKYKGMELQLFMHNQNQLDLLRVATGERMACSRY
jgi:hypothetical protein